MFQKNDALRNYVVTLLYTLAFSGLFFLWVWINEGDEFSSLMSRYGGSLLTYFLMVVVVVPLVRALTIRHHTSGSADSQQERRQCDE